MKKGIKLFGLLLVSLVFISASNDSDECGCIPVLRMTPEHVKCMNSASEFYNCIMGTNLEADDVFSYGFYIYTGEGTVMNRVRGDEWNMTINKHLLPNVHEFWIRGLQMKNTDGKQGEYLRRNAKVKFQKNKKKLEKMKKKAEKEAGKEEESAE